MKHLKSLIVCCIVVLSSIVTTDVKAQQQDFPGWQYRGTSIVPTSFSTIKLVVKIYMNPGTGEVGASSFVDGVPNGAFLLDGLLNVSISGVSTSGVTLYVPSSGGILPVTVPDGHYPASH